MRTVRFDVLGVSKCQAGWKGNGCQSICLHWRRNKGTTGADKIFALVSKPYAKGNPDTRTLLAWVARALDQVVTCRKLAGGGEDLASSSRYTGKLNESRCTQSSRIVCSAVILPYRDVALLFSRYEVRVPLPTTSPLETLGNCEACSVKYVMFMETHELDLGT